MYNKILEWWRKKELITEEDFSEVLENFNILFSFNSNKIEGNTTRFYTTRDVFETGEVVNFTGNIRELFEIQNQKFCNSKMQKYLAKKENISIEMIKDFHKLLTYGTYDDRRFNVNKERPGEFKKHDYVIGEGDFGSSPEEVEGDLIELLKEVNEIKITDDNVLKVIAYFHMSFEEIHPFADGNGRTGRTLVNYLLMLNNFPPIAIFNRDKQLYYDCLVKFNNERDIAPMIKFLEYETTKTWESYISKRNRKINFGAIEW